MSEGPKPRRRWFRYSLRTLLALVLVTCLGLGWFAHKLKQARDQKETVAAIRQLGGTPL